MKKYFKINYLITWTPFVWKGKEPAIKIIDNKHNFFMRATRRNKQTDMNKTAPFLLK
jgi:hypothetical protein